MSRNILPAATAIVVGVVSGIYIFNPVFKEEAQERQSGHSSQEPTSSSSSYSLTSSDSAASNEFHDQVRKTEERVANAGGATTISRDAPRWADVQSGQYGKVSDTFAWNQVPLDGFSKDDRSS